MTELYETSLTKEQKLKKIYEVINFPNDDGDSFYRPVMYGDACDWVENNISSLGLGVTIYSPMRGVKSFLDMEWEYKRLSLEYQTDDCIDYLFSLLP